MEPVVKKNTVNVYQPIDIAVMTAIAAMPTAIDECCGSAAAKMLATESADRGLARLVTRPIRNAAPGAGRRPTGTGASSASRDRLLRQRKSIPVSIRYAAPAIVKPA